MTRDAPLVLLAEDEPIASMALRAQVEALGFQVAAVARDGEEAAALARCLPVRLGVFDMKMPAATGLEAATLAFPHALTPVLLLTGFGAADLPDPIPEPPIFGVVTKPVGLADLGKGIERARASFDRWIEREDRLADVHRTLEERSDIARALTAAGDLPAARAALAFLRQADHQGTTPADLARRLLSPESDRDR